MTWYWWSHWFWITILSVLTHGSPISSVDTTISLKSIQQNAKNYNKPLKFPLAAQSDSEDIYSPGGEVNLFKGDLLHIQDQNKWSEIRSPATSGAAAIDFQPTHDNIIEHLPNDKLSNNNSSSSPNNSTISNSSNSATNNGSSNGNMALSNLTLLESSNESSLKPVNNASAETLEDNHSNATDLSVDASVENSTEIIDDAETYVSKENSTGRSGFEQTRKSKILSEFHDLKVESSGRIFSLERSAAVRESRRNDNLSSEALSVPENERELMNAGVISGICFSVIGLFCSVSVAAIVLYRRRYSNKPQTLNDPDSSGYIDDSTIRDNSDEMYSLDNDSFLNSLEAMTIQNYWTDSVKHTKL